MQKNRCAYIDSKHRITLSETETAKPQANEVLIQIKANGICGSDIKFYKEGRLGNFIVTAPYIPGHEACGTVICTGSGVTNVLPGDKVVIEPGLPCTFCNFCKSGRYNLCPDVVFLSAPPIILSRPSYRAYHKTKTLLPSI